MQNPAIDNAAVYLDEDFDLNGNGISGDLYDIMGATAFIRINYPERAAHSTEETTLKTASLQKGDVNGDGAVTALDALEIQKMDADTSSANQT